MNPVTLLDGTVVDSSSDAWRHECEARHLLDGMKLAPRRAYLAAINVRRGGAAYAALTATIMAIWTARKAAAGPSDD